MRLRKWIAITMLSGMLVQYVMGQPIQPCRNCILDVKTEIQGESLLVKSNDIKAIFDLDVTVDQGRSKVKIAELGNVLELTIGSKEAIFNGEKLQIATAPIVKGKEVYISLQVVGQIFCYQIESIGDRLVIKRNVTQETLDELTSFDKMFDEDELYNIRAILYEDEIWTEYAEKGLITEDGYKKCAERLTNRIDEFIGKVKKQQIVHTPLGKILFNQMFGACEQVKAYVEVSPFKVKEKKLAYERANLAFEEFDRTGEKVMGGYYGYENKDVIESIEVSFNKAEGYSYILNAEVTLEEKEEAKLILKANKMYLENIKETLKEDELIQLTKECIDIIDKQLELADLYEKAPSTQKQLLLESQNTIVAEQDHINSEFRHRFGSINVTQIDDEDLTGKSNEAICVTDSNLLATYKREILDLTDSIDLLGAKYLADINVKQECKEATKTLEMLLKKYEEIQLQLKSKQSEPYLELKRQVLVMNKEILEGLTNKSINKKDLLIKLNELEKMSINLYLRGYIVYEEGNEEEKIMQHIGS